MDDLKRMAVFASVVQHGSMTGAGRVLGMSPSAVSQQVRQLEREGGVTLLHRSTRKLALTEAGQRYHAQCAAMCAAAEQARAELGAGFVRILGYFREDGVKSVAAVEEAMRACNAAAMVIATVLLLGGVPLLRRIGKSDPRMFAVYASNLPYRARYQARASAFRRGH